MGTVALSYTPVPASYGENLARRWRTHGTHAINTGDGRVLVCGCGPANHVSGPQFAIVNGIERRTADVN